MWSPAHRLESGGAGRSPGTQRQNEVLGDDSGGEIPVPIPNTAVKPASADGTALATGWESRSSPGTSFSSAPLGLVCAARRGRGDPSRPANPESRANRAAVRLGTLAAPPEPPG